MALFTPVQIAMILIAITTYILYIKWVRSKYPPGPWPLPIIGNLHLLSRKPYIEFTKMSKVYGSVFTIWMGWQPTVVLSGLHRLKEALIEKGFDFADRAMDTPGFKLIFRDDLSSSYDQKLCTMRKLAFSVVKSKATGGFSVQKVNAEELQQLLERLKQINGKLVDPSSVIRLPISNIVTRAVLNIRFQNETDSEFVKWKEANVAIESALEKAMLMSLAPTLSKFMTGMKNKVRSLAQLYDDFVDMHLQHHEETYKMDTIRDFTDLILEYQQSQNKATASSERITRANASGLLRNMLLGGTSTTYVTILWSFLVLLHKECIQKKIQLELDQYFENRKKDLLASRSHIKDLDPIPLIFDISDKPNLPYLNAFIDETMRYYPVAPMASPRRTLVDTSVANNLLQKGTAVLLNIYGCHTDGINWEKPLDFIPERFLDKIGQFDNSKAKQLMTFGAGPRSCVGENLAKMEIFLCLANVLHTFELCCPSVEELPGLNDSHFWMELSPYPFKMMFKLRKVS